MIRYAAANIDVNKLDYHFVFNVIVIILNMIVPSRLFITGVMVCLCSYCTRLLYVFLFSYLPMGFLCVLLLYAYCTLYIIYLLNILLLPGTIWYYSNVGVIPGKYEYSIIYVLYSVYSIVPTVVL